MDTTHTIPAPFPVDTDPRPLLAAAVATGAQVVAAVRPDQLANPTPCPDFDVRDLLGHIVDVLHRVAAMGRGDDPMQLAPSGTGVADDAWLSTYTAVAAEARSAWSDDAALARTIVLPWATDSGAAALLGYVSELTVHTWDVAHATGQHPQWDDAVVAGALALMKTWLPGENRTAIFAAIHEKMGPGAADMPDPFAAVVPVPDDAPLIDRLVAWNGRRP
jgi:uncharacterized protein (TIGR03086 family)